MVGMESILPEDCRSSDLSFYVCLVWLCNVLLELKQH